MHVCVYVCSWILLDLPRARRESTVEYMHKKESFTSVGGPFRSIHLPKNRKGRRPIGKSQTHRGDCALSFAILSRSCHVFRLSYQVSHLSSTRTQPPSSLINFFPSLFLLSLPLSFSLPSLPFSLNTQRLLKPYRYQRTQERLHTFLGFSNRR